MKISIACPAAVAQNQSVLHPLKGAKVTVEGGLLAFDFQTEAPLEAIRDWDEGLGLAIADADDAGEIQALSQLKTAIAEVERHARRESSYSETRASEVAEATDDTVVSQLQGEQHTSTDDSSEQHGAVSLNDEENVSEQKAEEKPVGGKRRR